MVVGPHRPPMPHLVPLQMRDYMLDLEARWRVVVAQDDEHFLELLAFAEGRLLSIHPFADFNGRVTRLWLAELLRRAQFPLIDLSPAGSAREPYLAALASADRRDYRPLVEVWRHRLAQADLQGE